ncbi:MAG: hypothetical protein ACFFDH_17155 [Promethearchaeota archaeon]
MGLEILSKKSQISEDDVKGSSDFLNISNLIIPFSIIFRNEDLPDIYSGEESITFKERDLKFQQIFISEFL